MAGDTNGAEEVHATQDAQEKQAKVSGDGHGATDSVDCECAIGKRGARIAGLEAQTAKSAQIADELRAQIAGFKAQGENDRIDFRLRLAGGAQPQGGPRGADRPRRRRGGVRGGGALAVLAGRSTSQETSQNISGATSMEPAGVTGVTAERNMKRWEYIAGLTEKEA